MFELMLEFNPSLDIKNRQGLTPLNLAAKLARAEVILIFNKFNFYVFLKKTCSHKIDVLLYYEQIETRVVHVRGHFDGIISVEHNRYNCSGRLDRHHECYLFGRERGKFITYFYFF